MMHHSCVPLVFFCGQRMMSLYGLPENAFCMAMMAHEHLAQELGVGHVLSLQILQIAMVRFPYCLENVCVCVYDLTRVFCSRNQFADRDCERHDAALETASVILKACEPMECTPKARFLVQCCKLLRQVRSWFLF